MYQLEVIQQPRAAWVSSFSPSPLEPTPIVGLKLASNIAHDTSKLARNLLCYADFIRNDSDEEVLSVGWGKSVSSWFRQTRQEVSWAVFPGLGCREEGKYRLKFSLFEMQESKVRFWTSVFTQVFEVVPQPTQHDQNDSQQCAPPGSSISTSGSHSRDHSTTLEFQDVNTSTTNLSRHLLYTQGSSAQHPRDYNDVYQQPGTTSDRRRAAESSFDVGAAKRRRESVPYDFTAQSRYSYDDRFHTVLPSAHHDAGSTIDATLSSIIPPHYDHLMYYPAPPSLRHLHRPQPRYPPAFQPRIQVPPSHHPAPLQYAPEPIRYNPTTQSTHEGGSSTARSLARFDTGVISESSRRAGGGRSKSLEMILGDDTIDVKEGGAHDWFE